jgi:uncharacterized protein
MHPDPVVGLALPLPIVDVGRSCRDAFYMFWDTLWALVLGFTISGAVQAFVPHRSIERRLGDHRPASVARATAYGISSSSCSYAASAMARSLFVGGADFLASMVFMVASTNLVIELGIVLAVLVGWQFVAAEFVGGVGMIVLLVLLGGLWFRGRTIARARAHGGHADTGHSPDLDSQDPADRAGWRGRARTAVGWADAAGYTMSDLTMLRREMAIGFVVAGFLSALVPSSVWADVFVHGHGVWTVLENVSVGPFVGVVSFVCSVGNVPLAAALWHGGIGFGGVVAFVFSDLIAMPLLLVYRKQYGLGVAARMLAIFWVVMSAAGLVTQYLFESAGWVPSARPGVVAGDTFRWDWTTALDVVALVVVCVLVWLRRNRERFGGAAGEATDPVCGMQVEISHAPSSMLAVGERVFFCSDRCKERFARGSRARTGEDRIPLTSGVRDAAPP